MYESKPRSGNGKGQNQQRVAAAKLGRPGIKPGRKTYSVPIGRIRPNPKQPRKHFDHQKLVELAASIKAEGQGDLIKVMPVKGDPNHDWQITDGERRLRACKIAGLQTVEVVIDEGSVDDASQFRRSLMLNFCREGHTPLEIAEAVKRLRDNGEAVPSIAVLCGKSEAWVYQYLKIAEGLDPRVKAMMSPAVSKGQRIKAQVAIDLSSLPREVQAITARRLQGLPTDAARHQIRLVQARLGIIPSGKRGRRPSDDLDNLRTAIKTCQRKGNLLCQLPQTTFETMFGSINAKECQRILGNIGEVVELWSALKGRIERCKVRKP